MLINNMENILLHSFFSSCSHSLKFYFSRNANQLLLLFFWVDVVVPVVLFFDSSFTCSLLFILSLFRLGLSHSAPNIDRDVNRCYFIVRTNITTFPLFLCIPTTVLFARLLLTSVSRIRPPSRRLLVYFASIL